MATHYDISDMPTRKIPTYDQNYNNTITISSANCTFETMQRVLSNLQSESKYELKAHLQCSAL